MRVMRRTEICRRRARTHPYRRARVRRPVPTAGERCGGERVRRGGRLLLGGRGVVGAAAQRDLLDEERQHRRPPRRTGWPTRTPRQRDAMPWQRAVLDRRRQRLPSVAGSTWPPPPVICSAAAAAEPAGEVVLEVPDEDRAEQRHAERAADRAEEGRRAAGHAEVLLLHAVLRDQHGGLHQEAHADAEHRHEQRRAAAWSCPRPACDSRIMPTVMPTPPMIGKILYLPVLVMTWPAKSDTTIMAEPSSAAGAGRCWWPRRPARSAGTAAGS